MHLTIVDREHTELDYLNLVKRILPQGNRAATGVLSVFSPPLARYSLRDQFPLLTTRRLFWEGLFDEQLRILEGEWFQNIIDAIKANPEALGITPCAWNLRGQATCQFNVCNGELSCLLFQPSGDMWSDVPFNIASCSLVMYMIAHITGLKLGDLVHSLGEARICPNYIESLNVQIQRKPRPFPQLKILGTVERIDDFRAENFQLCDYNPHPDFEMQNGGA